jgi:luciferase family oxidoreductase group 1
VRLGALDQTPIIRGTPPAVAVLQSVELAHEVEQMGYHRFWLAEHHNMRGLADPCPEILLTHIASVTSRIRVGTGGVLLPYYSPLKVAETFRMLEALFPGRIDLGIGRAPGSDGLTAQVLAQGTSPDWGRFPVAVQELLAFLLDALPDDHPYAGVRAQPAGPGHPEVWLLGSSDYSAELAAHLGLRFCFAHFINGHGGDAVTRAYREQWQAASGDRQPQSMVAVFVVCAPTDAQAERLAASIDLRRLQMARGHDGPIVPTEDAAATPLTDADRAVIRRERVRAVIGDPARVRDGLLALRDAYASDEVMVLTITGDPASRIASYALVADALQPAAEPA